jgi:hypothetical protein
MTCAPLIGFAYIDEVNMVAAREALRHDGNGRLADVRSRGFDELQKTGRVLHRGKSLPRRTL